MKRLVGICTLVVAAVVTLGTLAAGDNLAKGRDADAYFHKLDLNRDGRLSKDEFVRIADKFRDKDKEKARNKLGQTYDKLDPTHRGLTRDEFRVFVEARARKKEENARKAEK